MNIDLNIDELVDYTPEEIAHALFTHEPKPENSCQIIAEQELANMTYIFEILMIILMEGLEILTGNLSTANLVNLSCDHVMALNPWFLSLGFNINVNIYNKGTDAINLYNKHYCKIIIKDKLQKILFGPLLEVEIKNINKNYHFFINGDDFEENKHKNELKNLHAILINDNVIFKISFDFNYQ